MELHERIKQRMDAKAWKLADLARESGVAKGYLWELLQGTERKRPSAETLYEVARALGTSVGDLLGRTTGVQAAGESGVPVMLQELAEEAQLTEEDVAMLASIRFRGEQPKTKDDWRFLWESIRRSVRK